MKPLTWIIAEAKKIKKQYPKRFTKWTEYVAQASAIYASKHKGKSPVGKKKVSGTKTHKDTKSHNVNIKVVSGVGSYYGMFSKEGNKKVAELVKYAIKHKLTIPELRKKILILEKKYPEILDTEPREAIYEAVYEKGGVKVSGWRKGGTAIIEKDEKPLKNFKNVRVKRIPKKDLFNKPGTFKHFSTLSGYFDTTIIKDIDSLKKEYFKLAKKYHPDAGGTNEQMKDLNIEYEKMLKALLSGSTLNSEQRENELQIDKALRDVIDSIISLEGINIELIGKWIWVSGNTYPIHKILKAAGLVFFKKEGVPYWVYKGVESKSRGGTTVEEIRKKYGVTKFDKPIYKKISGFVGYINKVKLKYSLNKLLKGLNKRPV